MQSFSPPYTPLEELKQSIKQSGFGLLQDVDFFRFTKTNQPQWDALKGAWHNLVDDKYLKDGGKYRKRRHASIIVRAPLIEKVTYRPHFQPTSYNALHGGMQRWFSECSEDFLNHSGMQALFLHLANLFDQIVSETSGSNLISPITWFTEVHQFRIDTAHGIGRPTPEGAHRDGVNFVAVLLVNRHHVKGGETRVFSANSPHGVRFTLEDAWTLLLLDDEKVIHETTPIQPLNALHPENSWRDTLVLTFRKDGFLDANLSAQNTLPTKDQ